ncbi:MAG: hypothetical protein ACK5KU_10165 [Beutenbergiaceae bacterium]
MRTDPLLRLGINTCFAVKRWQQPEQWAAITAELGLNSVQLSLDLLPVTFDPADCLHYARRAAKAADAAGIDIHSAFTGLAAYASPLLLSDDADERRAAQGWYGVMIDVAAEAGATGMGGHIGALSVGSAADRQRSAMLLDQQIEAMLELAERARIAGLNHLQFENLAVTREPGHSIEQAHQLEQALADSAVPWRLCLDVGHPPSLPAGTPSASAASWVAQTWEHTPVVQLQQSPIGADHHGPFTAAANAAGAVDRDTILAGLADWDADEVPLFFEIIHAHEAPDELVLADLRESVGYWRAGIGAHS